MTARKENCGIIGIASSEDVVHNIFCGLRVIQHRGQESAGIATYNNQIECITGMGLVHEALPNDKRKSIKGNVGIGHVRYSTTGTSILKNAQPFVGRISNYEIAVAHNGDIINVGELKIALEKKGIPLITESDSELILKTIAVELVTNKNIHTALKNALKKFVGSFSLVVLINGRIYAIRDPYGIMPLCIGKNKNSYIVASESIVMDFLGAELIRDVLPGEIIELHSTSFHAVHYKSVPHPAHCMFQWVYFARPDSVIEGRLVYDVRYNIGKILAKEHPVSADYVIPIPDSGRSFALGYSQSSRIPLTEGLIKNRYIERTFIMPEQEQRELGVLLKINPIKNRIRDQRIIIVDDSLVRGTTMRKIVDIVRKAGAKSVHVRIGCPPIIAPCYLGIDMKTRKQLAAARYTIEEIRRQLNADSLGYISLEGLVKAIGLNKNDLCLGCLTGEYPVPIPGERLRFQTLIDNRVNAECEMRNAECLVHRA